MRARFASGLLLCLITAHGSPAHANTSTPFPVGSLIIPVGSSFQDDCGSVSAYGLVYDVLRANPWLAANGYAPITIYYTYLDTKASPNRCVPTSLNTGAAPSGPPTASTAWNDGCDITNVSAQAINPANHSTVAFDITTFNTASTTTVANQCSGGTNNGGSCASVLDAAPDCPGSSHSGDCAVAGSCVATGSATCKLSGTTCSVKHGSGTCTYVAAAPACKSGTVNAGDACTVGAAGDSYCAEYSCVTVSTTTAAKSNVYPTYSSKTATAPATVSYLGGPFVISANDADTFRKLIDGTLVSTISGKCSNGATCASSAQCGTGTSGVCAGPLNSKAKDIKGNLIDFTPFVTAAGTSPNATQHAAPTSSCTLGVDHHVNIHIAKSAFTANVGKAFANVPPRIALLGTDTLFGTQKVYDGILEGYLTNAGLTYNGSFGCAPGSINTLNAGICPNAGAQGQIYDVLDFGDLVNNKIAAKDANGNSLYAMLWTPHWETSTSCSSTSASCSRLSGSGTCTLNSAKNGCNSSGSATCKFVAAGRTCSAPSSSEQTALSNIKTFLNGQNGLSAECASIASYEGDYLSGSANEESGAQLQTCVNNGAGVCSGSSTLYGISRNGTPPGVGAGGGGGGGGGTALVLKNCSDPGTSTGATCAYFSYPGDSFAQTGDYIWQAVTGHTATFIPNTATTAMYQSGVAPLISAAQLDPTKLGTPAPFPGCGTGVPWASCQSAAALGARAMITADLATRSIKDNTPGKSNILYLAGHDQDASVAGTKVMLETLLQLGISTLPPVSTTTEASRSSPIAALVNGTQAIMQGTYENVQPPATPTTFSVSADSSTFRFPTIKGHMRARTATSISTTASTFASTGVIFDAANQIPAPNYNGCSTWFTSSCRTVFTTTATGLRPALHYLRSSELATIGPLMGPAVGANPALSSADQATLIQRVLAGDDSSISGVFVPKLGGVDRSSVAVIEANATVNSTRPTIAYFGATDGMLHAVCAKTGGPCDVLGRELWAYLPRTMLPVERYNTGRIDGSPHVMDMFGDFYGTGTKQWRTILLFQTGSGDTTTQNRVPAVYALDVSDPTAPTVLWEYSLANVASLGTYELGVGLVVAAGRIQVGGVVKSVAFAQTSNVGSAGVGNVITAIDVETGAKYWQTGTSFTRRLAADRVVPATAIPGGAVAIDKAGNGYVTDLVYATIYGELWEVDPTTGTSRYGAGHPLFSFSTDYHPIGAVPAIYAKTQNGPQYAVITDGGYADSTDSNWTTATTLHYAIAIALNTPTADATLTEASIAPDLALKLQFAAGEAAYAQARVIGGELFVTTDSSDVNASAYGTAGATGHVYRMDVTTAAQGTTVAIRGGATSLASTGATVYSGSSDQTQQLAQNANSATGATVTFSTTAKLNRTLWLRSE